MYIFTTRYFSEVTKVANRLRNDLYCVEWDVKLYYTIPYQGRESKQIVRVLQYKYPMIDDDEYILACSCCLSVTYWSLSDVVDANFATSSGRPEVRSFQFQRDLSSVIPEQGSAPGPRWGSSH